MVQNGLKISLTDLLANHGYIIVPGGKSYPVSEKTMAISLTGFLKLENLEVRS